MSASYGREVNRRLWDEFGDAGTVLVADRAPAAGLKQRVELEMQGIKYPAPTPVRRRGIRRWQAVAVILLLIIIGLGILVKDFVPRRARLIGPTPVYAAVVAAPPAAPPIETPDTTAPAPAVPPSQWNNHDDVPHGRPIDLNRTDWVITQTNAQHWANEGLSGLDLAFPANSFGSPLHATLRGVVGTLKDRGDGTGYGNAVYTLGFVSPSGLSYNTVMGHFQKLYVQDGQQVARGTVLGEMGSTGWSTGPHVHYEVWQCQMTADEVQRGTLPGTTNPSHSECTALDPQAFIGQLVGFGLRIVDFREEQTDGKEQTSEDSGQAAD